MAEFSLGSAALGTEINLDGLYSGIEEAHGVAERGFNSIGGTIATTLKNGVLLAGAAITTAIAGITASAMTSFIGFERQINEVFTLLPDSSQQAMNAMSNQVKDFATDFGVLPKDVVPALYEALSSGVPEGNVFDFLAVAQKAAIGGVTDTKTTVDGLTSVVNSYGADVLSVQEASDQMFTAVAYGKTSFADLSNSLYNVIPNAQALGISFSDVTAAIASMTAMGVPTSVSTTQLRQLLVELSQSGGEAAETFKQIAGVGFKDFIAQGHNLQDALILMEEAAKRNNVGINDLFGSVEAGGAALALTGRNTQSFTAALEQMANSSGATDRAFKVMDEGIGRSIDYIKASIATLLIDVANRLAPTFAVFADWVQAHMPQISSMVLGVFDGIGIAIQFVTTAFGVFIGGAQQAFGAFIGLAQSAVNYGRNIGEQLANGILSAASYVMQALNSIADMITYWLEPHSPPKILPEIDTWGTETAQVWMDGWGGVDYQIFDQIGSTIESLLKSMVDTGVLPEEGMIPMLLGSQAAVATAIDELRTTGTVSERAFAAVRSSAGAAGDQVDRMFRSMVAMEQANRDAATAQRELNSITEKYNAILSPLDAQLQAIRDQQADVRDAQRAAQLQELINSTGGDEAERQAAALELQALNLEKKIRDTKKSQGAEQSAAQAKLDAATKAKSVLEADISLQNQQIKAQQKQNDLIQRQIDLLSKAAGMGGGGGGGAAMDDAAKKAEAAAKAQREYQFATADTAGKIALLREEQSKYTEADAEYWRLKTQITSTEQQYQRELEASAESQRDYELSLADTETKLASLKAEQSQYAVGSEEYNKIQKEIVKVEKEREKALAEVEKKNADAAKAERDYQYATADTAGKIGILQKELAGAEKGSSEYWRIRTQLNSVEQQYQREQEASAKATEGAGGSAKGAAKGMGALAGGLSNVNKGAQPLPPALEAAQRAADAVNKALDGMGKAQDTVTGAFQRANPILNIVKAVFAGIASVLNERKTQEAGAALGETVGNLATGFSGVGTAITTITSNIGTLGGSAFAAGQTFARVFERAASITRTVLETLDRLPLTMQAIAVDVGASLKGIFNSLNIEIDPARIKEALGRIGERIKGTITTVMTEGWGAVSINWGTVFGSWPMQILGAVTTIFGGLTLAPVVATFWGGLVAAFSGPAPGIKSLFAKITTTFKPLLTALDDLFVVFIGQFRNFSVGIAAGIDLIRGWFTTLGSWIGSALAPIGAAITKAFGPIGAGLSKLFGPFSSLFGWVTRLVSPLGALLGPLGAVGSAVGGLLGPLLAAVAPFVAIGGAIALLLNQSPELKAALEGWTAQLGQWVLDAIPGLFSALNSFIGGLLDWLAGELPEVITTLVGWSKAMFDWVVAAIPPLLDGLAEFIGKLFNFVVENVPNLVAQLAGWGASIIGWVIDALPGLATNLGEFLGKLLGFIVDAIPGVVANLAQLAAKFIGWVITDVLPGLPGTLLKIGEAIYGFLAGVLEGVGPKLAAIGMAFINWISTDVLPVIGGKLGEIWTAISDWISDTAGKALNAAKSIGEGIANGISDAVSGGLKGLRSFVAKIINPIITGINAVIDGLNLVNPGDDIARIAYMAKGGITDGGLTVMGELGLERVTGNGIDVLAGPGLFNVPAGLKVTPAAQTMRDLLAPMQALQLPSSLTRMPARMSGMHPSMPAAATTTENYTINQYFAATDSANVRTDAKRGLNEASREIAGKARLKQQSYRRK